MFGLLLGEIREDPTCARPWVRVNRLVHGPAISGDPSAVSLSEILNSLTSGLDDPRPVVGWYRSHPGAGLYLSTEEARFHEERFADPWGFAFILVGDAGRLTGSVFQRTDPEGLSRSVYTPFYELVDDSSEFNGTTKRTYVGWPNYQTETRVVQAGQGSVSAQIPGGSKALIESPPSPPPEPEPVVQAPLPEPEPVVQAPPPEPLSDQGVDGDWEKKQIQRSLTAVGRSLGAGSLGGLGTPVQVDRTPPRESPGSTGPETGEPEETMSAPAEPLIRPRHEESVVIPIHRGSDAPSEANDGLVGRARRQGKVPVAKIASAAAGLAILLGGGWIGSQIMDRRPIVDDSDSSRGGSAAAGLSLAPTDLFTTETGSAPIDSLVDDTLVAHLDTSFVTIGPMGVDVSADTSEASTEEDPTPEVGDPEPESVVETPPPSPPPAPEIVAAPEVGSLSLDSPQVSAFKNALQIFRQEIARYEELRTAFDEGDEACNPLNLAERGVREAFVRLEARFQTAAEQFAGRELRSFDGARRQKAMIETHYGLTDCPVSPTGGR